MSSVLVVDDDPVVRRVTCLLVEALGGEATATASMEEALEALRVVEGRWPDVSHDVVVCDFQMPGRSGLDLLRHMRGSGTLCGIRFIGATGNPANAESFLAAGAAAVLAKPFSLAALRGALGFAASGAQR